jgi:arabinofuranan 3-O-arabinosyltransferase
MSDDQPLVSVIIPTRNAGKIIGRCLESIQSQSYRSLEIIVVDNYSSDETRRVVEKYHAKFITAGPPPPYNNFFTAPIQRRVGAEHARGAFLFFVDADMILSQGLIEECVKRCEKGADAVTIPEISFGTGFWAKCKQIERACYINDPRIEAPRFIRKSAYVQAGGWSEMFGAFDDWNMAKRLRACNLRIDYCTNNYILHDEGHLTLRGLFFKKYRMGKTIDLRHISGQNLSVISYQLTPFRILLLRKVVLFTKNPIYILGVFLMKLVEATGMLIGFLMQTFRFYRI